MPYGFNDDKSKFNLEDTVNNVSNLVNNVRNIVDSIALVETSPSLANHSVGDYIMYDDRLYKVISPIASGDALVRNSNIYMTRYSSEISFMQHEVRKTVTAQSATSIESMGIGNITIPLDPPDSQYVLKSVWSIRTGSPYGVIYGFYAPQFDQIKVDIKNVSSNTINVTPSVGVVLGWRD